jgi:hypothetical protein
MAENFNTLLLVDYIVPPDKRMEIVLAISNIFSPFFDDFYEICLMNYLDNSIHCENFFDGELLLKTKISRNELIFIYGNRSNDLKDKGPRSNIHIEEIDVGTEFIISLPISNEADFSSSNAEKYILKLQELAENISSKFIVAAGWELECDADENIEAILASYFSNTSIALWIGISKLLMPIWPKEFRMVTESDRSILLKNTTSSI